MTKGALRFLAAVLTTGIVVVPFLGLDNLPRDLRSRLDRERTEFVTTQQRFVSARREVLEHLRAEPELFRVRGMAEAFPARLAKVEATLGAAAADIAQIDRLRKANRRQDRAEAERLLADERRLSAGAIAETTAVQSETRRWIDLKRNLPTTLAQMERDRQALHADVSGLSGIVNKAAADWPAKKPDLENRLGALRALPAQADKTWEDSAPLRAKAAARDYEAIDYAALAIAADGIHASAAAFDGKVRELRSLPGQLYDTWDKVLIDLDRQGGRHREKIRTVRTHFTDVAAKKTEVSSAEEWVEVSPAQYNAARRNVGMAIEHKPAGKYDYEAERVAQPAGYAYMASPEEGRNQYGHWENRGGQSFWVWYGQYALLRDLLTPRQYHAPERRDWESYRTSRERGQTWRAPDENSRPGSSGYAGSTYSRPGGFDDSKYATRPGGYGGSKYQTPAQRGGGYNYSRPSSPRSAPRSAPSRGRSFGGRRR